MKWNLKHLGNMAFTLVLAGGTGLATWWLMRAPPKSTTPTKPEPPAAVFLKESDLIVITLKPEAERRLGLHVVPVEYRDVPRVRTYGAEVMVPPGQSIAVAAPLSGIVHRAEGERLRAGLRVTKGQPIVQFIPILSPDTRANLAASLVEAEGQAKAARTQVDATTIALNRARQLFTQEAGSRRAVDEASAQADLARRALESAEARRDLLAKVARDADAGAVASQVINAPASGILRSIQALAGETVATGTNLFEILVLDELWLRVPVYVGDLDLIEAGAKANVETLTNRPSSVVLPAKPVMAPPSANPQAATVDLYFDLGPGVKGFVPGQRVAASLTLKGKTKILVVPSSAVVYDIHGGTWVYEQSEPLRYTRRRVVIDRVAGDQAVVASGLAEGSKIVVAGAAELFGTEVGFAK